MAGSLTLSQDAQCPAAAMPARNYLYFWDTYTLYATVRPAAEPHTHTNASITISLDSPFVLEADGHATREYDAVYVPPGIAHRVAPPRGPGLRRLVVQMEPGSETYYRLGQLLSAQAPVALDASGFDQHFEALRRQLAPLFLGRLECAAAHACFHLILEAIIAHPAVQGQAHGEARVNDERIARVVAQLRAMPELPAGLSAARLAASVGLSTERFRHLFRAEMGLPVRRYLLWLRIRRAGEIVATGVSLTEAAHAAGFYDSAHLSRTCKEILGFPPSFLTGQGVEMIHCVPDGRDETQGSHVPPGGRD